MAGPLPPLPPGSYVDVGDRGAMWVWDSGGDGPPVVLVHGFTSTAALTWSQTMAPLARGFRVIAPDQRGHGRGLRTPRFSLAECADDLAALVEAVGCGPAIVVGYSMGGPIALLTWRRHPASVAGLVLCATAARFSGRSDIAPVVTAVGAGLSLLVSALPSALTHAALGQMASGSDPDPDRARWVRSEQGGTEPATLFQAAAALNAFDATGWLGEVAVPTSVIITSRDQTVSPAAQWHLARTIPGATHATLLAGHRACVEDAAAFVPLLEGACSSLAAPGRG